MRKTIPFLFLLLAQALGLSMSAHAQQVSSLNFSTEGVEANLFWEKGPLSNNESILRIEFVNSLSHEPSPLHSELSVVPKMQMGSMEHGTSPVTIDKIKDTNGNEITGQYRISRIFFVMSGTWKVKVNLTHADHSVETQILTVQVPSHETR